MTRSATIGFIGCGVWDEAPLELALLAEADRQVRGEDAWLIVDDTALPKKGRHSVGVVPQYASTLGKNANCQTLVSLTLASGEVPVMVGLRVFLPESWTSDAACLERAHVPRSVASLRLYRTKPEIAQAKIDKDPGVRFGCVLADAGYGLSAASGRAERARSCMGRFSIPFKQKVCTAGVAMVFPVVTRGESPDRHRNRACRRSDKPSLTGSPDHRTDHARTADASHMIRLGTFCQSSASET